MTKYARLAYRKIGLFSSVTIAPYAGSIGRRWSERSGCLTPLLLEGVEGGDEVHADPMSCAFRAWKSASRASSPVISLIQGPLNAPMNV